MEQFDLKLADIIAGSAADPNFAKDAAGAALNFWQNLPNLSKEDRVRPAQIVRRWKFGLGAVAGKQVVDDVRSRMTADVAFPDGFHARNDRLLAIDGAEQLGALLRHRTERMASVRSSFSERLGSLQPFIYADSAAAGQVPNTSSVLMVYNDLGTGAGHTSALAAATYALALRTRDNGLIRMWPHIAARSTRLLTELASLSDYQSMLASGVVMDRAHSGMPAYYVFDLDKIELRDGDRGPYTYWTAPYKSILQMRVDHDRTKKIYNTTWLPTEMMEAKVLGDVKRTPGVVSGCPGVRPIELAESPVSGSISPIQATLSVAITGMAHRDFVHRYDYEDEIVRTVISDRDPQTVMAELDAIGLDGLGVSRRTDRPLGRDVDMQPTIDFL